MADNKQQTISTTTGEPNIGDGRYGPTLQEGSGPAKWFNGDSKKKRMVILGAIVATIVVVCVVIVALNRKDRTHSDCQLTWSYEGFDRGRQLRWSEDKRVIADFYGYFRYPDYSDPSIDAWLEFRFESVKLEPGKRGQQVMTLSSDCAKLSFLIASNSSSTSVKTVQVNLALPNDGDTQCVIEPGISAPSNRHYTCNTEYIYSCKAKKRAGNTSRDTVQLYVRHLEFEVDGDPEKTEQGEFSRQPYSC